MNTINKLRDQVDRLKTDSEKQEQHQENTQRLHVVVFILMLASILYLVIRKRKIKA